MSSADHTLTRRALSLGTANAIDYSLQFALPLVLTRTLDPQSFGEYRLLWLAMSTIMLIAPMCMPASLYYFLPRSDAPTQRLYVNQTMLFLAGAGVLAAWALSAADPLLPGTFVQIGQGNPFLVPAFVLLWVFASMLDELPTADERIGWQAKALVALSAVRTLTVSAAAIFTHDLAAVLWTLVAVTCIKVSLLLFYVARYHGLRGPIARADAYKAQFRQAAPFALSGALHGVRTQGDQWIAAALFTVPMFAAFSVGTVLAPLVQLFRQSVNHVFLPSMSRMQSKGDFKSMLGLNSQANCMVAVLAYPLLAFAFVFAEPLITFVYTATYIDAAPVLRIYSIGLVAFVVELTSVLFVLGQGAFAARVNALVLIIALPMSWFGATHWGLMGAATGSVLAIYAERLLSLNRIAMLTGTTVTRLQDWASLAAILVAAALSAAIAGAALRWSHWGALPTLMAGACIVAATYPLTLLVVGQRARLTAFFHSLRGTPAAAP